MRWSNSISIREVYIHFYSSSVAPSLRVSLHFHCTPLTISTPCRWARSHRVTLNRVSRRIQRIKLPGEAEKYSIPNGSGSFLIRTAILSFRGIVAPQPAPQCRSINASLRDDCSSGKRRAVFLFVSRCLWE